MVDGASLNAKLHLNHNSLWPLHFFLLVAAPAVRDFDEKTRQNETLKTPKKLVIFASNRFTYSKFHNENRANRTRVPAVKFLHKNNMF